MKLLRLAALAGMAYAGKKYLDSNPEAQQKVRDMADRAQAEVRKSTGQLRGRAGSLGGNGTDDATLADRVRSQLGPLEKRLDVPHVNVTAEQGTIKLHGEVPGVDDARSLEEAARAVPGVRGVESHLAVGLSSGTHRPSEGHEAGHAHTTNGAHARS